MFNAQKIKDADWNNPKTISVQEIAECMIDYYSKQLASKDDSELSVNLDKPVDQESLATILKDPLYLKSKLSLCTPKRRKQIQSAYSEQYQKIFNENFKNIKNDPFDNYDTINNEGEKQNSLLRSLHLILTLNERYGEFFLPNVNEPYKWDKKKQITKITEAKIIREFLYYVELNQVEIKMTIETIKKKTNQQIRNNTNYPTLTEWANTCKQIIIDELLENGTSHTKAKIIATKCLSLLKKITKV